MLVRVLGTMFNEQVQLDLDVAAERLLPVEPFRFDLEQAGSGAPGPGKVAVEVHRDRHLVRLRPVESLETNERGGLGDFLAVLIDLLPNKKKLVLLAVLADRVLKNAALDVSLHLLPQLLPHGIRDPHPELSRIGAVPFHDEVVEYIEWVP